MANEPFDAISLMHDLDPEARRRLWIVGHFVERCGWREIDYVISVAARIESFIVTGSMPEQGGAAGEGTAASAGSDPVDLKVCVPALAPTLSTDPVKIETPTRKGQGVQRPLLDPDVKARFIQEAARNPDNRHLARTFGLSVRQAHAARIGVSRHIALVRREPEPQTQDEFGDQAKSDSTRTG